MRPPWCTSLSSGRRTSPARVRSSAISSLKNNIFNWIKVGRFHSGWWKYFDSQATKEYDIYFLIEMFYLSRILDFCQDLDSVDFVIVTIISYYQILVFWWLWLWNRILSVIDKLLLLAYYLGLGILPRHWHISLLPGYCLMNPAELPKYCQESVGSRL